MLRPYNPCCDISSAQDNAARISSNSKKLFELERVHTVEPYAHTSAHDTPRVDTRGRGRSCSFAGAGDDGGAIFEDGGRRQGVGYVPAVDTPTTLYHYRSYTPHL